MIFLAALRAAGQARGHFNFTLKIVYPLYEPGRTKISFKRGRFTLLSLTLSHYGLLVVASVHVYGILHLLRLMLYFLATRPEAIRIHPKKLCFNCFVHVVALAFKN